jgi:hypothetical protein
MLTAVLITVGGGCPASEDLDEDEEFQVRFASKAILGAAVFGVATFGSGAVASAECIHSMDRVQQPAQTTTPQQSDPDPLTPAEYIHAGDGNSDPLSPAEFIYSTYRAQRPAQTTPANFIYT